MSKIKINYYSQIYFKRLLKQLVIIIKTKKSNFINIINNYTVNLNENNSTIKKMKWYSTTKLYQDN